MSLALLTGRYGKGIYAGSLIAAFAITVILAITGITLATSLAALATAPMMLILIKDFRRGVEDIDARTGRLYTLFYLLFGIGMMISPYV